MMKIRFLNAGNTTSLRVTDTLSDLWLVQVLFCKLLTLSATMDLILPLSGRLQVGQESSHRWWHSLHRMWPDIHCGERKGFKLQPNWVMLYYVRNPDLINWRLSGQSEANRALDLLLQRYHRRVLETLLKGRWRISAFLLQKIRRLYCEELVPIYHCELNQSVTRSNYEEDA